MTIFGVDIHPQYQAGISIEQIRAEGFDFLAVKVSEGTATYGGQDWLRRGKACGLLTLAYHYLRPFNEINQARVFCNQLKLAGVPGMLDVEAVNNQGIATLEVSNILAFLSECRNQGVNVPLMYLPRWYWERMHSPSLIGLPCLWASSYPAMRTGFASALYEKVSSGRWAAYGGLPVEVLQFTDQAKVAGKLIDANAYLGTRDDFAKLIGVIDLDATQSRKLDEIHDFLFAQLPTRADNPDEDPQHPYMGTLADYAVNADGYGWRNERQSIPAINKRLDSIEQTLSDIAAILAAQTKPPAGKVT